MLQQLILCLGLSVLLVQGKPSEAVAGTKDKTTKAICVSDCTGVADGDYQACDGCHHFIKCSNGNLFVFDCPANLVWDDNIKRCEWTSSTCRGPPHEDECVSDCAGVADGDYQACDGCHHFVKCSNGYFFKFDCPANLVWDDIKKRCEWTSTTCPGMAKAQTM